MKKNQLNQVSMSKITAVFSSQPKLYFHSHLSDYFWRSFVIKFFYVLTVYYKNGEKNEN